MGPFPFTPHFLEPDREAAMAQFDAIIIGTGQAGPALAGAVRALPAVRPVKAYPVQVEGDEVSVDVG